MTINQNSKSAHYEADEIVDYLRGQAADETVERLEKTATRHVGSNRYDIWDVQTDQNRWWVITPLTNLYLQSDIPSLDQALTLHLGIVEQLRARHEPSADQESVDRATKTLRLWDQAVDAFNTAREAEDYQAVGVRLRETLLTLIHDVRDADWTKAVDSQPKAADFASWLDVIAQNALAGDDNRRIRKHLRSTGATTWQLVNWLTHYRNASKFDAEIAIQSVDHVISVLLLSIVRYERDAPRRCPSCGSYRISSYFRTADTPLFHYVTACEVCEWEADVGTSPN